MGGVCSESWFELRAEMESGFKGREERDLSPSSFWIPWEKTAKILSMEKMLLCPSAMGNVENFVPSFVPTFATIHCPSPSPDSLVGMFEPPLSWEMGSG